MKVNSKFPALYAKNGCLVLPNRTNRAQNWGKDGVEMRPVTTTEGGIVMSMPKDFVKKKEIIVNKRYSI